MLKPPINEKDHLEGDPKASIELVEYGDYECPHCGRAYGIIKNIQHQLGKDLRFYFRNFPLSEIHPHATAAAIAAEAAALQDSFWPMHDIIFENQEHLGIVHLVGYAKELGLDVDQFKKDLESEALAAKVEKDFESGVRSGVNGTPTFYINGEKYTGNWDQLVLLPYLKQLL